MIQRLNCPPIRLVLLQLLALPAIWDTAAAAPAPPNIVVILTDDQGWGDLSCNGNTNLETPAIDSLAREGASFAHFFVQPVCSPTRAEFLTGRYHPRGGVRNVSQGGERLDLSSRTIADAFRGAGYATGAFGKWHNGTQYPYHPLGRGFDEYYGFTSGHWGDYFDPPLDHNGYPVRGKGYLPDDMTDHAIEFIQSHSESPFFCYLAFNTPHSPMQVPDRYWSRFSAAELPLRYPGPEPEDLPHTRAALAMCENIDWNVGRILRTLAEEDLAANTIVVYFCDNGPNGWRWNDGLKGRKGSTDEGGVRSPLLIRWPLRIAAGTRIDRICGAIDLFPTLAQLADVPVAAGAAFDGLSLSEQLLGSSTSPQERMLFQHWNKKVSVRTERYRLAANGQLFDMQADPGQTEDIRQAKLEVAQSLDLAVAEWRMDVLSSIADPDDRPFPVGHRELPRATLPARDGIPHGGIRRSAAAPNCSYFTNWRSLDDRISWEIELATSGTYGVEIEYACPKADVGATLDLEFGNSRLVAEVSEYHDPLARGNEHDRVPRTAESLVKDFRTQRLGEFQLSAGRGPLTLRATKIPGGSVLELRSLTMTLLP